MAAKILVTAVIILHVQCLCYDKLYSIPHVKDPVKIRLGTKKKAQGLGSKRRLVEKEEDFVYVPILQTLQALLTNETVLSEVKFNVCRV